jgi:hypothetical protein
MFGDVLGLALPPLVRGELGEVVGLSSLGALLSSLEVGEKLRFPPVESLGNMVGAAEKVDTGRSVGAALRVTFGGWLGLPLGGLLDAVALTPLEGVALGTWLGISPGDTLNATDGVDDAVTLLGSMLEDVDGASVEISVTVLLGLWLGGGKSVALGALLGGVDVELSLNEVVGLCVGASKSATLGSLVGELDGFDV